MAGIHRDAGARRGRGALLLTAALACALWGFPLAPAVVLQAGELQELGSALGEESRGLKGLVKDHVLKLAAMTYVLSFLIAKKEPKARVPAPAAPTFEKRADLSLVMSVSVVLSLVSGIVNAVAIIEMGGTVAHHTGNASHAGRLAGTDGLRFAALMVAYFVGAGVVGFCDCDGEALYAKRPSPAMVGSALAVVAGAVIHWASGNALVALPLLSFSQGIQNAICRRCTGLPVCTTHMTGYLTDAGAAFGTSMRSFSPLSLRGKFFSASILAFVGGGFLAKMMLDTCGILVTCFVPAVIMALSGFGLLGAAPKQA